MKLRIGFLRGGGGGGGVSYPSPPPPSSGLVYGTEGENNACSQSNQVGLNNGFNRSLSRFTIALMQSTINGQKEGV